MYQLLVDYLSKADIMEGKKKYYLSLNGLDSRNGQRILIADGGKMCYTWVNELIDKYVFIKKSHVAIT